MKIKGIKHVFFDLDHTLWDFDKNSALTFEKIFNNHNFDFSTSVFLKAYEPINLKYWRLYRNEEISKANLRYKRLKDSFDAIDVVVPDNIINTLAEDYINYLTTFNHLFDGCINVLEYLHQNYELHIITNGFAEAQQRKMDTANISRYFKTVTHSESAGVKKPNPIIFNHALQVSGARPEESVMIGDSYEADIMGALQAGIDAILFNYHNHTAAPNIKQVSKLLDLKMYL